MKTCEKCQTSWEVSESEQQFLQKVSPTLKGQTYPVLEPTLCPNCRHQHRLAFRNENKLYLRKCESCQKQMVSLYSPDKKYHVYCQDCWWSDKWDPVDQGRDLDFNRPFFEQFAELIHASKLITLFGKNNQNSEFVNQETDDKNCYMNSGGHYNEDCYHNTYSIWSKNSVDNYWVIRSELLYECIKCDHCFSGTFLEYCEHCNDCHYCLDLKGCHDCFGCINLRHKEYHFFNQPLSPDEYKSKVAAYLSSHAGRQKALAESQTHFLKFPHKDARLIQCINSTGDDLLNCKNVHEGYLFENSHDCKYCYIGLDLKDGLDLSSFGWGEVLYNCASSVELNHVMVASSTTNLDFSQYCFICFNSSYLFGCVGLNRKEYCILNKQYTKQEYEKLVPKIIEHLQKTDEWGVFFPPAISPFGYNETVAQEYFPLTQTQAEKAGWNWKDKDQREYKPQTYSGSYDIEKVSDSIINEIFACQAPAVIPDSDRESTPTSQTCHRNYRLVKQELEFYRRLQIPLPSACPTCRHHRRLQRKNPHQLWERQCQKCQATVKTSYAPGRPETVYCEQCYLKEVY